jgi:hypothetical protein
MIKRISFDAYPGAWRDAVAGAAEAPPGVRPVRMAVCLALPGLCDPKHDRIGIEWFCDAAHLRRFQDWLDASGARRHADTAASPVIVATEFVLRGADWLERRWRDGGEKLKHMAIALRASGLTPAEFSERWRNRAGQVRGPGSAAVTVIPDEARGRAYVQNHPCPRSVGAWAYDALNEVYVDDEESLRTRIEWFREHLAGQAERDLVRQSWFIAARERAVLT